MKYTINAHNGFIEEYPANSLQEVKEYVDNAIGDIQEKVTIEVDGKVVSIRRRCFEETEDASVNSSIPWVLSHGNSCWEDVST